MAYPYNNPFNNKTMKQKIKIGNKKFNFKKQEITVSLNPTELLDLAMSLEKLGRDEDSTSLDWTIKTKIIHKNIPQKTNIHIIKELWN
jgi:hypothetical protein